MFEEAKTKVGRARRHVAELEELVSSHQKLHPPEVDFRFVRGEEPARLHMKFKSPPLEFSAIVGDVVHNLRAALDLMIVEFSGAEGEGLKKVYFPFANSADELPNMIKLRGLGGLSEPALALIWELEPFAGGNELLRAIHDLDILDKHRALIPRNSLATTPPVTASLVDGQIELSLGDEPPSVVPVFPEDGPLANRPVIPSLYAAAECVEQILDRFAALAGT